MTEQSKTLTKIDQLLAYKEALETPGRSFVRRWMGGELQPDGTLTFPWPEYEPDVVEFFLLAGQRWWTDFDYQPEVSGPMLDDDDQVATATLDQLRTMITYAVRGERFTDGHWGQLLHRGRVQALLDRLAVLREEIARGEGD